jgi:hypothetical protein
MTFFLTLFRKSLTALLTDFHKLAAKLEAHADHKLKVAGQLSDMANSLDVKAKEAASEAGHASRIAERIRSLIE